MDLYGYYIRPNSYYCDKNHPFLSNKDCYVVYPLRYNINPILESGLRINLQS